MSFFILFFLSFLIRLILIPLPGFKADIAYWKWWGMSAAHDGLSGPLTNTAYNYPSFYLYILKATSHIYEFFTGFNFKLNPHDAAFWSDSNLLYLFLIKMPYILADLGIGFLIYKIVVHVFADEWQSKRKTGDGASVVRGSANWRTPPATRALAGPVLLTGPAIFAASLFLFNPVVIYNSSVWGQTDSIGSLFVLLSFYCLITNRYSLTAVFAAVSLFMKTQTLVLLPILFLGIFLNAGDSASVVRGFFSLFSKNNPPATRALAGPALQEVIRSFWVFIATVIVINLPFLATHTMDRVFDIMYNSQLYFPYVSMNAYNLWWLFFGKNSSSFWDQNLIAGLISFKTAGFLLFGGVYCFAIGFIIKVNARRVTGRVLSKFFVRQSADQNNFWQNERRQDPLKGNIIYHISPAQLFRYKQFRLRLSI